MVTQSDIKKLVDDLLGMGGVISTMGEYHEIPPGELTYEWKTPKEVAAIFGVEQSSVYNWIKWNWIFADEIPAKSRVRYRIPDSEVRRIQRNESRLRRYNMRNLPRLLYKAENGLKPR